MFLIITLVIFFILFILFIPISINIKTNIMCNNSFLAIENIKGLDNKITIKLFSIFPIFIKKIHKNLKFKSDNKFKKIMKYKNIIYNLIKKCYVEKFVLSLGFNFEDYLSNCYINATLNAILCLGINLNQNNFNLKRLYYQTYIGENLVNLNFDSIINISLADTIEVISKEYIKLLKETIKVKILQFNKRRDKYDRASD